MHSANSVTARAREQVHRAVAKAINRLLRIADQKNRLAVPIPSLDQPAEQLKLRQRRILHFVDKQMLHLHSKSQCQRIRLIVERMACRKRNLDEVRTPRLRKRNFQFGHCATQ